MQLAPCTPLYPDEAALAGSLLEAKASRLRQASAFLCGQASCGVRGVVGALMADVNSYYSNLIEGNRTELHEIRRAHQGDFSLNPEKRDRQLESMAHIATQRWIEAQSPDLRTVFSPEFIKSVHRKFCESLPPSLLLAKGLEGDAVPVLPGEWRTRSVRVGQHIPPSAELVQGMMEMFAREYTQSHLAGDRQIIAILAAHHRLVWVHPFLDGNGRVARLITDAALKAAGLESVGIWCLSRGLARTQGEYRRHLALADQARQGNLDGRGALSMKSLVGLCEYLLDQAIDQITYLSGILDFQGMRRRIEGYVQARADNRVLGMGPLKSESILILHHAFMAGEISRADALRMCPGGERHGRRLLSQLREEGLLGEISTRSPLTWEIPDHALPWYFPQLVGV